MLAVRDSIIKCSLFGINCMSPFSEKKGKRFKVKEAEQVPPYSGTDQPIFLESKHNNQQLPDYHQAHHAGTFHYKFVMAEKLLKQNHYVFVSADSMGKYRSFKGVSLDSPIDTHQKVSTLQHQGIGIPLLSANIAWKENFKIDKSMTIYKYNRPPKMRLFDKNLDKELFCVVKLRESAQYYRYEFEFVKSNRKMTFFLHRKHPFGDVCFSGSDIRYRWLHSKYSMWRDRYRYDILRLPLTQPSLLDGMDMEKNKLNPSNKLVGSKLAAFTLPTRKVLDSIKGGQTFGGIEYFRNYSLKRYSQDATMDLNVPKTLPGADPESISSVDEHTLELLCMGLVLHKRESDRRAERRNSGG